MKISPAAEFAVRGVLVLAEQYGQGPVTLNAVCDERHLPKQYLSKLFASLAKADLVTPIRGKRGGYVLTRDPKGITLLEVIEAIEGALGAELLPARPLQVRRCPVPHPPGMGRPPTGLSREAVEREACRLPVRQRPRRRTERGLRQIAAERSTSRPHESPQFRMDIVGVGLFVGEECRTDPVSAERLTGATPRAPAEWTMDGCSLI